MFISRFTSRLQDRCCRSGRTTAKCSRLHWDWTWCEVSSSSFSLSPLLTASLSSQRVYSLFGDLCHKQAMVTIYLSGLSWLAAIYSRDDHPSQVDGQSGFNDLSFTKQRRSLKRTSCGVFPRRFLSFSVTAVVWRVTAMVTSRS